MNTTWIKILLWFLLHTFVYGLAFSILVPDTAGVPVEDWRRPRSSENERQRLHRQSSHRVPIYREGWQRPGDTYFL